MSTPPVTPPEPADHHITDKIVRVFLQSNLSLILILLASLVGLAALVMTPREEDPQIVVPMADIMVSVPGRSATEVEQLVTTPLERVLYQIDGVEHVYSTSRAEQALVIVRFHVGQDRERSLVKIFKKLDENQDLIPASVARWIVKPVEIDDVPVVTFTLRGGSDPLAQRRVAEELAARLATQNDLSRVQVLGGQPRQIRVELRPDQLEAHRLDPLLVQQAITTSNQAYQSGEMTTGQSRTQVRAGYLLTNTTMLEQLVVGVWQEKPVYLHQVARVVDGASELDNYVRHIWGPAHEVTPHHNAPGTRIAGLASPEASTAITIALAKKPGTNAVTVAEHAIQHAQELAPALLPAGMELIITRNNGLTANEKVNELVEGLLVAILIVIMLLTVGLGWREAIIVTVAVPVVFGLTLAVNMLLGFSINRVTLFALILALGLLVDDPIVDVENISRHFGLLGRASKRIVMEAVAEIRPPLITATLAVILSFIPMFFITGMMGPYMRPMALNVPVAMAMSMLVAFTITPWLSYHILKGHVGKLARSHQTEAHDTDVKQTRVYKFFYPIMAPLLHKRWIAYSFLAAVAVLTGAAMYLAANRSVPLKMLPFDNKNELLLVLDFPEGTTLQTSDAAVRAFEHYLVTVPEVTDLTSYVGLASPMDFNGLVRHYYLRRGDNVAEIRLNLVSKKNRTQQSHALGLSLRAELDRIAQAHNVALKLIETPPGPPVLASVVAEVYGTPTQSYDEILGALGTLRQRVAREPGVVDVDDTREAAQTRWFFQLDQEKAALNGISAQQVAASVQIATGGVSLGELRVPAERQPLQIEMRLPRNLRTSPTDLERLSLTGRNGQLVRLSELGHWQQATVEQPIYHKDLQRVAYLFAETAGRPPAEVVLDIQADQKTTGPIPATQPYGWVATTPGRPLAGRTYLRNGSDIAWQLPAGVRVNFAGEGEWQITLNVFRDLGLAFAAAMVAIYILLVWQTSSFVVPLIVMMAIPLTVLGVMPGFWLLNAMGSHNVGGYHDGIFFTATAMIGMIALSGIVTRDAIILVDFIHLSLKRGHNLFDAIMESRVVRLRPILLTAGAAMLSAVPIIVDPIFSGLAWSLIFGLFASTLFTIFVIPLVYWLLYANRPGHGLPVDNMDE